MTARRFARVAIAGLLLAGCEAAPHQEDADHERAPAAVTIATVEAGTIDDMLAATGETQAVAAVRLASPIAGRLTALGPQPGAAIRRGAVVARVISLENEAALNGLELLRQGEAEASAAADLARAMRGRDVAVRSPIDGTVSARLHNAGEQVAAGDVLLEAFDPASVIVVAEVPITSVARVRPGLDAEIVGAHFTARGHVDAVVPAAAPSTVTVPVRIVLDDPAAAALLHEPVSVRIRLAKGRPALLIPRSAVVSSTAGSTATVVVAEHGTAHLRTIEIGARSDARIEVVAGLDAGAEVVAEGAYGLADGAPIRPAEAAEPRASR